MKRILYFSFVAAISLVLASCVKDKGNYDYTDLNGPTWDKTEGLTRSWTLLTGDHVTIKSFFTLPESNDTYTYEWRNITNGGTHMDLMSSDRDFEFVMGENERYKFQFRIKNNRTGVWYKDPKTYSVDRAGSLISKGFVFLTQRGNDIGIEMLADPVEKYTGDHIKYGSDFLLRNEGIPVANQLETTNRRAIQLASVGNEKESSLGRIEWRELWVLTDKDCYTLNSNFEKGRSIGSTMLSTSFYTPSAPDAWVPSKIVHSHSYGSDDFGLGIRYGSNWFWRGSYAGSPFALDNAVNVSLDDARLDPVGKEFSVGEHAVALHYGNVMLMWSESERKFLLKQGGSPTGAPPKDQSIFYASKWLVDGAAGANEVQASTNSTDGDQFNVVEAGREVLFMDNMNAAGNFFVVVKDGSTYKLLTLFSNKGAIVKQAAFTFPSADVANAKFFVFGSENWANSVVTRWKYAYYVTNDNRVVAFHANNSDLVETPITNVVPANHEVVAFKSVFTGEQGKTNSERMQLQVVTREPTLGDDECCTFAVYNLSTNDSGLTLATYKPITWDPTNKDGQGGYKDVVYEWVLKPGSSTEYEWKETADNRPVLEMRWSGLGRVVDFGYR